MKAPEKISEADFVELETLVKANPYFQNGHSLLAHASRRLKKPSSPKKMGTAAIYATNRNIFKQYILGQIKFGQSQTTATPAEVPKTTPKPKGVTPQAPAPRKAPKHNTDAEQDALVKEIYENLEKWKASREHYLDYDKKHPEEIVIEDPFASRETPPEAAPPITDEAKAPEVTGKKVSEPEIAEGKTELDEVEKLKNQVAEEIEAEEETISKALSDLTEKNRKEEETEPIAEETSDEPQAKEQPAASISSISSDELTAIVDAESSIDSSQTAKDSEDSTQDIEQSIESDTQAVDTTQEEETSDEVIPAEIPVAAEIVQKPEEIEESILEPAEEKESEAKPTPQKEEEEEVELTLTIDTNSDKSTEETEEELNQIGKEIQELKLTPGSMPTGKKFRLGVLKRGTKFTKEKVKKANKTATLKKSVAKSKIEPTPKAEPKAPTTSKTTAKKETTKKAATKTTKTASTKTTASKKETSPKKTATAKKDPEKKPTKKASKAATAKTTKSTASKAEPKAKKETTKKAPPKFRMSASLGTKAKKKTTGKKTTKKDDESSSEKKKPKEVSSTQQKNKKKEVDQSNIIDSFIELNPTIQVSKDKQQYDSPVEDLAARYDAFPEDMVTENLASILISQGKVEKAIEIYQKLILKNPQKKAYFASQIEKLNKK